jgi:hypothetical protein
MKSHYATISAWQSREVRPQGSPGLVPEVSQAGVEGAGGARGYFAVTSGTITDELINEYINEQEGELDFKSTPLEPLALQARVIQLCQECHQYKRHDPVSLGLISTREFQGVQRQKWCTWFRTGYSKS